MFRADIANIDALYPAFRYSRLFSKDEVGLPESWEMVDEFAEPKPIRLYGVTKLFGEDPGQVLRTNDTDVRDQSQGQQLRA